MPPYALLFLPRPNRRATHATTLSKTGNLLKSRVQKTLIMKGLLPISMSRTSTSAAKLFSVGEVADRSKVGMKRGDNRPETSLVDRQHAYRPKSPGVGMSRNSKAICNTVQTHTYIYIFYQARAFLDSVQKKGFPRGRLIRSPHQSSTFPLNKKKKKSKAGHVLLKVVFFHPSSTPR